MFTRYDNGDGDGDGDGDGNEDDDNGNDDDDGKWQKFEDTVHCWVVQQLPERTFDARAKLGIIIYWSNHHIDIDDDEDASHDDDNDNDDKDDKDVFAP